jgi:hypothetical protein
LSGSKGAVTDNLSGPDRDSNGQPAANYKSFRFFSERRRRNFRACPSNGFAERPPKTRPHDGKPFPKAPRRADARPCAIRGQVFPVASVSQVVGVDANLSRWRNDWPTVEFATNLETGLGRRCGDRLDALSPLRHRRRQIKYAGTASFPPGPEFDNISCRWDWDG